VSLVGTPPADGEGWRTVAADGATMLDGECFVAMNRFSVLDGRGAAFEQRFAERDSTLAERDGFRGFLLLRRDGDKKPGDGRAPDDGFTHSTFSVWRDRAAFEAWRASTSADAKKPAAAPAAAEEGAAAKAKPPSIYARPPVPVFYEGILVLESAKGV
jgi:heme-degrading monooxygenase HmoA